MVMTSSQFEIVLMDGAEKPFCHPKQSSLSTFQAYNVILIGRVSPGQR
jgi:hypothetical protein